MSKESFLELLDLAREGLERDEIQGLRSSYGGVVSPELRLSMTLRWLAGGSYVDIAIIHGVAISTFYKVAISSMSASYARDLPMTRTPGVCPRWGAR